MFYVKQLQREMLIEPRFLGSKMRKFIVKKVHDEMEGQCIGKYGYIIAILDVEDIKPGLIENDSGSVNVMVKYTVMLLRPFRNEVLDAIVTMASDENGFFCRVGPLQIFVSRHCVPEDISFNAITSDCWVSEDEKVEIREGSIIRLRVIGISIDAGSIHAVGSIKETYLGQLEV